MAQTIDPIEVLKALGDSTRYKILNLLSASGNKLCVTAIAEKLEISQPVISQHLKVLKNAGIVSADRAGYHIHYSLNLNTLSDLIGQLQTLLEISSQKCSQTECLIPYKNK